MTLRRTSIAVIGAGPYGLSLCAHLSAYGCEPAVFGRPMDSWRNGTPPGMRLKSDGFASSLSDPAGAFTLKAFCEASGRAYADINLPTPIATFVAYGDAFQRRFAPQLDTRRVRALRRRSEGFELELEDGASLIADQCAIATGLTEFEHLPPPLRGLSRDRVAHTAQLSDYSVFAGARVAVVGAGASATNAAGELLRNGADVTLICRDALRFYPGGSARRWTDALTAPLSPIGPGWGKWGVSRFPAAFHALPERLRVKLVDTTLGPAPAWFVREEIEGKIAVQGGRRIVAARGTGAGVEIDGVDKDGVATTQEFGFVIAGAGYKIDVARLSFLAPQLRADLKCVSGAPRLSARFESSIPGLYFLGPSAAYEFGPALRFVCGANYAARRVSAAMVARSRRRDARSASPSDFHGSAKISASSGAEL